MGTSVSGAQRDFFRDKQARRRTMKSSCLLAAAVCTFAETEAFFFAPATAPRVVAGVRDQACTPLCAGPTMVDGMLYDVYPDPGEEKVEEKPFVMSEFVEMICSSEEYPSGWDGFSQPEKLEKLLELPKDARDWDVEGERDEVWEGDPNPPQESPWAEAFAPSPQEVDAASVGYDFENPDAWEETLDMLLKKELRQFTERGKEWVAYCEANPKMGETFKARIAEVMEECGDKLDDEERELMAAVVNVVKQTELAAAE